MPNPIWPQQYDKDGNPGPDHMPDFSCPACIEHALTHDGNTGAEGRLVCFDCLKKMARHLVWLDCTEDYA
jgi:hypothetical protein